MTTKRMIEIIEDLAENEGKSAEAFLLQIVENAEAERAEKFKAYPPEVQDMAADAERIKRSMREEKRNQREKERFDAEIRVFTESFPGVKPEDVPQKVWEDVADGIPLAYAYAFSLHSGDKTSDEINALNDARSVPVAPGRAEDAAFTEKEVEKMPPAAVKSNFAKIISSMKKWRS